MFVSEVIDRPLQWGSSRDRVLVSGVGNADEAASGVDFEHAGVLGRGPVLCPM